MVGEEDGGTAPDGPGGRTPPPHWRPSRADHVFEALNDRRRRAICRILQTTRERGIEDLAMDVAVHEASDDERTVTNHEWERVFGSLYHSHVPKLEALGVVRFDHATGVVSPGPRFTPVVKVLSAAEDLLTYGADPSDSSDE